jgi:hypothetical protein
MKVQCTKALIVSVVRLHPVNVNKFCYRCCTLPLVGALNCQIALLGSVVLDLWH